MSTWARFSVMIMERAVPAQSARYPWPSVGLIVEPEYQRPSGGRKHVDHRGHPVTPSVSEPGWGDGHVSPRHWREHGGGRL